MTGITNGGRRTDYIVIHVGLSAEVFGSELKFRIKNCKIHYFRILGTPFEQYG